MIEWKGKNKVFTLTAEEVYATRRLSESVEVRKQVDFHNDAQFSPDAMHCIINRKPATDHGPMFPHQEWVEVDVNLPYSIVCTVSVMV